MKTIAIIPARGGSKRIPNKNIINFMDEPLISYTIEAAQKSGIFERIVVSTDSEEIAGVARNFGIEVPFLRNQAMDDNAPVSEATITAVKQSQKYWKENYDIVVQLMPNCPLRGRSEILSSYNNFISRGVDFQLSCFKFGWMNPWWAFKLGENQKPDYLFKEQFAKRSQDQQALYCPTGAIWLAKNEALMRDKSFYGRDHIFFPIDWKTAVDIDNYEDIEFAKAIFNILQKEINI